MGLEQRYDNADAILHAVENQWVKFWTPNLTLDVAVRDENKSENKKWTFVMFIKVSNYI